MTKELILAVDIGSSSVRGALFDVRGRMVKQTFARVDRLLRSTRDGGAEIDADLAFKQTVKVLDQVIENASTVRGDITKIVSCTFWHSLVGVNANGKPTTPVFGWADNRSRLYVADLKKVFDETKIHNRTGAHFHSSFWPAKLLWMRREHQDVWKLTAEWISVGDHIQRRFTGTKESDISIASGTGIFDQTQCIWDRELIRHLRGQQAMLPPIAPTGFNVPLLAKWKKRWPRLADSKWHPPVSDGLANSIGSGCARNGRLALMVGTSAAMRVMIDGPPPDNIPAGLWCYRADRESVILGGALSDGGGLFEWIKRNLRIDMTDAALEKEIRRRGLRSHGLSVDPFFAGERSTGYDEFASGAIKGLTTGHDAVDIAHAAMDAVAKRLGDVFRRIERVANISEVVGSGGALTASSVWRDLISEAIGRKITLSTEPEASMRGAVLLAAGTLAE